MPVGPQHRSGGSRSGGSSRSSSSFGRSRSSRSYSGGIRPVIIYNGSSSSNSASMPAIDPALLESYKRKNKAMAFVALAIVLLVIMTISLIVCATIKNDNAKKIEIMDADAIYYENLLNDGSAHREEAHVKWSSYYMTYNGVDYYYIEYYIFNSSYNIDGETYAQYTSADVNAIGDTISIVFNDEGYSINADWTKENAEYLYTQSKLKSFNTTVTILIILEVLSVLGLAFAIKNAVKVNKEEAPKIKNAMQKRSEEKKESQDAAKYGKKCEYCGSRIKDDVQKCPNCGASIK